MKSFLAILMLLGVTSVALAQGGGFNAGDLLIYTDVQSASYSGSGILRVDPSSGASSVLVQTTGLYPAQGLAMAFDPSRQRLVFSAAIGNAFNHVWFADGAGNLQNITASQFPNGLYLDNFAPAGDGRIYCHHDAGNVPAPMYWFDAANQLHVLYDSDGVTPMRIDGAYYAFNGMIHDAATNSLFVASTQPKPGFPNWAINVRKLPLSADGTRVIGPVGNVQFECSPNPQQTTSGETPRGWSHGPNGQLVLCVQCIDYPVLPRMLLVDPVTSAITVWGSNGIANGTDAYANTPAGAYTSALDMVVVVDSTHDALRAYAQGSVGGAGSGIAIGPASSPYGSTVQVTSVSPDDCSGGWIAYGLGLVGKGSYVPELTGAGCAEPGSSITVNLSNAVGGANAALFVGFSKAALPFYGGTFHVGVAPLIVANFPVGGAIGAAGAGSIALPAVLPALPALSGTSVFLQAAFADAAAAQGVSLTQGLELAIG